MSLDNLNQSAGPEVPPPGSGPASTNEAVGASPAAVAETPTNELSASAEATTEPSFSDQTFGDMLEAMEEQASSIKVGQMITGRLIALRDDAAFVDVGFKTEGIVPAAEIKESMQEVSVGSEIPVVVKELDAPDGYIRLSYKEALQKQMWGQIEKAAESGAPVKGRIVERVKGGFKVNLGGVEAFLPASQLNLHQVRNPESWQGKDIEAKIIKLNRKQANIVISRRALLEEEQAAKRNEVMNSLEEGYIVQGRVKSLTDYGAFIDLGGVDGLLHITDMAWKRVQHAKDLVKVGDILQLKILKLDREAGRINLGLKQLLPDPWDTISERYPVGSRILGRVTRIVNYGAFVELEEGIEGLIHVSEMSWDKRLKHPSKYVKVDDQVMVEVIGADAKERRLSFSLRQLEPDPWKLFAETHSPGTRLKGIVRGMTDFGAFVEVEKGIEGLVHVSDISRQKVKHPSDVLKKGQEVEVVIQHIDYNNRKLSLSMKELEPDPWEVFFATHRPGDIVKGKIARVVNFGVFVDLGSGVEGLCHISELSEERVEKPEDVVQIGQEYDFRILKLDPSQRRIGLSTRAAVEKAEPTSYTVNDDSGRLASLGEIAGRGAEKREE
ncbi:MAG: 30S ribosomal protein S1 [Acidobacteriota bacterium]|nr:30S ribosomal protein S1 [Blastocatellia bacterium]MDW8239159.1 30S ribosomal protein S1 [Acidobacteriota bacterium]